jgi:membrane protein implicated in regulation of membrane protease activity
MSGIYSWWEELSSLQQVFVVMATPATVILFLQTLLLLFGMGHGHSTEFESDTSGLGDSGTPDGHALEFHDHDTSSHDDFSGLRIFTLRGIIALLAIGGWTGAVVAGGTGSAPLSIVSALIAGLAALILVALFFKGILSLQENGNTPIKTAVGKTAEVYLRVPANRSGTGKVNVLLGSQLVEAEALTDSDMDIFPHEQVSITAVEERILIVQRKTTSTANKEDD